MTPGSVPAKGSVRTFRKAENGSSMGMVMSGMPRFSASSCASRRLPSEENRDGMATPITLSEPRASTAITAVRLESTPPDRPITTFRKPFLRT